MKIIMIAHGSFRFPKILCLDAKSFNIAPASIQWTILNRTILKIQSVSNPVEAAHPALEEPAQPEIPGEPITNVSSTVALKPRPILKSPEQTVKSFDRIVIPTLKINTPVVSQPYSELSWDLSSLGQDVAHLGNIPNQESVNNVVMAGHVTVYDGSNGPFRYLWKLLPGDQILLDEGNST